MISRGDHPWFQVDTDSIRRGSDNLVYYRSRGSTFEYDKAVDCQKRIVFFLKRLTLEFFKKHMPEDKIYSNWRSEGRAVVERTVSGAELQYVCANV